jgi:hypothetical protein
LEEKERKMEHHEQVDAFSFELDNLVDRFLIEFDVGIHAIVGVLEDKKLDLLVGKDVEFNLDDEAEEDLFSDEDL